MAASDFTTGRSSFLRQPGAVSATFTKSVAVCRPDTLPSRLSTTVTPSGIETRGVPISSDGSRRATWVLSRRISLVPIQQGRSDWNCQTWVVEALRGLNQPHMYAVQMDHAQWFQQMAIVEKAWDVGDA
ncbi:hypothetical protein JVT61DRAFT_9093 [Boletus reticuloceps]|uniref:Uncharacterized protein n=1 Tax=Boletus reticuloceps TaxID=495285 RepID=A0A8I2YI28_9AGAM|nr:hypothetical protein JVT61DRAFT_9093 [Boletus reticuloceps]